MANRDTWRIATGHQKRITLALNGLRANIDRGKDHLVAITKTELQALKRPKRAKRNLV